MLSYEFFCWLPHQKYGPSPTLASSSSRLVTGDDQLDLPKHARVVLVCSAPRAEAIRPVNDRPDREPPSMQCWQLYWTFIQPSILLRGVTCHVRRPDVFFQCRRQSPALSSGA